jgi:hypothetical protein
MVEGAGVVEVEVRVVVEEGLEGAVVREEVRGAWVGLGVEEVREVVEGKEVAVQAAVLQAGMQLPTTI